MKSKRGILETFGSLFIAIILITLVAFVMWQLFFGGFISYEANAVNTQRNLQEGINSLKFGTTPWSAAFACKEIEVTVFPDYQIIAENREIIILHRDTEEGVEKIDSIPYNNPVPESSNEVCIPYGFDMSSHSSHCPYPLKFNQNWDDRIIGKYCVCATKKASFIGGIIRLTVPKDYRGKVLVFPKKLGSLTCANVMGTVIEKSITVSGEYIEEKYEDVVEYGEEKIETITGTEEPKEQIITEGDSTAQGSEKIAEDEAKS